MYAIKHPMFNPGDEGIFSYEQQIAHQREIRVVEPRHYDDEDEVEDAVGLALSDTSHLWGEILTNHDISLSAEELAVASIRGRHLRRTM